MVTFDDEQIGEMITAPKEWTGKAGLSKPRARQGHLVSDGWLTGEDGSEFRILVRRSMSEKVSFSAILMVRVPGSTRWFRLLRYNGRHWHRNRIEGNRFRDFHIHTATARYQADGRREDAYAEVSDRYADCDGAVRCLMRDANMQVASGGDPNQISMPGEDFR